MRKHMRRFVLGDLHGGYKALKQVLERADFHADDKLILLGDVVDGWPETAQCVEYLRQLPNLVFVRGNHDQWFLDYINTGEKPRIWVEQGGRATLDSYRTGIPKSHARFFTASTLFHIEDDCFFVHGGFDPQHMPELQADEVLMWDRDLIRRAWQAWKLGAPQQFSVFKRVYLGHTSIVRYKLTVPTIMGNVVGMDTGGGWEGKLALMNLDTDEYFQSDFVADLYPGHQPRG